MEGDRVIGTGTGRTRTISRTRLWFESENRLPIGMLVELAVAWPARLDNRVLKLITLWSHDPSVKEPRICTTYGAKSGQAESFGMRLEKIGAQSGNYG
jgi:hypothetical protein